MAARLTRRTFRSSLFVWVGSAAGAVRQGPHAREQMRVNQAAVKRSAGATPRQRQLSVCSNCRKFFTSRVRWRGPFSPVPHGHTAMIRGINAGFVHLERLPRIPAKAGIQQERSDLPKIDRVPAFAGTSGSGNSQLTALGLA
jgi:hypothetical protein